jgi:hypothetical protein
MLSNYLPRTADIDGSTLIFYDASYALGCVELHEDQEIYGTSFGPNDELISGKDVPGTLEIWPDDFEGEHAFIRVKPGTLRIFERGIIPDRGEFQVYFDSDENRQFILDDFPALKQEAERRDYLDALTRWDRHPAHDDGNADPPPQPVFEPARAEWAIWQAALAEWQALMSALDLEMGDRRREGRPAMNDNQKARVDALSGKIQTLGNAYWSKVPVSNIEPKAQEEVSRQKLFGPPANALVGNTALAIAGLAARPIDDFNEGWHSVERWPDAPQLPSAANENYPAIFKQLNSAISRIVAMAQKPRTFRVDRAAHILAILAHVHQDTFKELFDLIRANKCALPDDTLARAHKHFEERILWEIQGRNRTGYVSGAGNKPDPASFDNIRIFLNLRGVDIRFDEFTNSMESFEQSDRQWKRLGETQRESLWLDTHTTAHNFNCSKDFFRAGLDRIAREYSYDALRDTIDALKWDGVERLGSWLSKAIGSPNDSYHRAAGANLIGGLVKRAREPGAKHDETVIFISEEGKSKSSLCKALALRPEWFIDSVELGGRPQDVIPQLKGKQIIELAELAGISKTETTKLKAFMSRENDNATLKYKEEASDHFRRHIFIATTNEDAPLLSQTGNRRWLPVRVDGEIDLDWIRDNREQLYAEAAEWHASGEDFRIPKALWSVAGQHQDAARERTGAEDVLAFSFGEERDCYVTAADVQLFASERRLPLKDVRAALKGLGFASKAQRDGTVGRVWRRGNAGTAVRFKAEIYTNRPCELRIDALTAAARAIGSLPPPCPVPRSGG